MPEIGDVTIPVYIDNKSAVAMANADGTRTASRYFSDLLEFLRQHRELGTVSFHHVSAKDQKANFLTKRVSGKALQANLDDIQTRV
jgi:predicted deacetylase